MNDRSRRIPPRHHARGRINYGTMIEVDHDSILIRGQEYETREAFRDPVLGYIEDPQTASDLTAVQAGTCSAVAPSTWARSSTCSSSNGMPGSTSRTPTTTNCSIVTN